MTVSQRLLAFEPDLIFSSKIESLSRKFGVTAKVVTSVDGLLKDLAGSMPIAVTLNLDALQGKLEALEEIAHKPFPVFGYYSHVDTALAEEARRLGIHTVIARGAFCVPV